MEAVDAARAARHLDDELLAPLDLGQDLVLHLHPGHGLELRDVRDHLVDPRMLVEEEEELRALEALPVEALSAGGREDERSRGRARDGRAAETKHRAARDGSGAPR